MTIVSDFLEWLAPAPVGRSRRRLQAVRGRARARLPSRRSTASPPRASERRSHNLGPERPPPILKSNGTRERVVQASRVIGAPVFDAWGRRCGRISDLSIDKRTGEVIYALIGVHGGLGFLQRLCPAPWSLLRYDASRGGYVAPADRADLARGPALTSETLQYLGAGDDAWRARLAVYESPYLAMPFI